MIRVRFACGHDRSIAEHITTPPRCSCGETLIARTFARAPMFRGAVSGPYAATKAVDPAVVDLGYRPLTIKE